MQLDEKFDELFAEAESGATGRRPTQAEGADQKMIQTAEGGEWHPVTKVEDAPTLVNRKLPFYENKQERPSHRLMLELAAKGYAVNEIAQRTGYTSVCVNNILRQPMLQQTLVNEIRKETSTDEEVVEIIKQNVVKAVKSLAKIATDVDAKNSDRIAAANALLDRRYGKPNTPINRGTDVDLNALSDKELAAMLPPTQATGTQ